LELLHLRVDLCAAGASARWVEGAERSDHRHALLLQLLHSRDPPLLAPAGHCFRRRLHQGALGWLRPRLHLGRPRAEGLGKTASTPKVRWPKSSPSGSSPRGLEAYGSTLASLREAYGWKILGMLAIAQWVIKGLVWGFSLSTLDFLLRDYAVSGPKMQVYRAVTMLPWAMKPLFGLVSDAVPIFGYRKAPYIVVVTVVAVCAHAAIGLSPERSLPVRMVVTCLVLGCVQASVVDLLTEAGYAEKIRRRPESGPDLMTFVWGGITLGNLLATACVGVIIEHYGPHAVYAVIVLPAALVLVPTCLNWMEEKRLTPEEAAGHRARLWEQKELVVLVVLTGTGTLLLVGVGLLQESIWVNFGVGVAVAVVVVGAFLLLLRPIISLMNCFFFIQTCCVVDISGASFYFFTDDAVEYPQGPHFSKIFFASGLGVCIALLNLFGMWIYNKYMQHWRYHGLFIFANLLLCVISLFSLLVYARLNVVMGMPDVFFVLGTSGALGVVNMWMWLPGVVLLSHLCPSGVEATMYALLAGCHNLGLSVASYAGACLLQWLGVSPRGEPNEGHQFDNLWVAGLVQSIMPLLSLVLLPLMIPNERQTDRLLEPGSSAVEGSPWQRLSASCKSCLGSKEADGLEAGTCQYGAVGTGRTT